MFVGCCDLMTVSVSNSLMCLSAQSLVTHQVFEVLEFQRRVSRRDLCNRLFVGVCLCIHE